MQTNEIRPIHWAEVRAKTKKTCLNKKCNKDILPGQIYYRWGHRFHTLIGCSPECMNDQDGIWH